MRQIREIVNDSPVLEETLCAEENGSCECEIGNNIIYGIQTDEGKMDYMLGFSQDLAVKETTECSDTVFGDPTPGSTKSCWCQRWISSSTVSSTSAAQTFSSNDIAGIASMA